MSIKEAAEAVKKAMDFDGEIVVSFHSATLKQCFNLRDPHIQLLANKLHHKCRMN